MGKGVGVAVLVVFGLLQGSGSVAGGGASDHRLARARNAALGIDDGFDFGMSPRSAEERDALFAVRHEIDRWGRFWIVPRERAEILISIRIREPFGRRTPARPRDGLAFQDEGSERVDVLSVYDARPGLLGVALWRGSRAGGLSGDQPLLLKDLQAHIEKLDQRP